MFSYEQDNKLKGLVMHNDGIYDNSLAAYSVEKNEFNKHLTKRRFIGSGIILSLIAIPSALIPSGGNMGELGIFSAIVFAFILFFGGLIELIELFKKDALLFKYSTGYNSQCHLLEGTNQSFVHQRTYSKIFAENGNTLFWFKLLHLKDETLLREATEIMLAEQDLQHIVKKSENYRMMVDQSNDSDIAFLGQRSQDNLLVLEGKFNEFKNEVMKAKIDHNFDIDEVMEMAVKVKF